MEREKGGRETLLFLTFPRSLSKSIPPSDPRYPFEQGLKTSIKLVPVAVNAYLEGNAMEEKRAPRAMGWEGSGKGKDRGKEREQLEHGQ